MRLRLLAGLLVAIPAWAQQADTTRPRTADSLTVRVLPELVSSTSLPTPTRVPPGTGDVTVDPVLVRRTMAVNNWDLLRRTAGLEIREQGQGPGFASNAILRGFTSDHSSDVLLVIDGMPVNLPLNGHTEGYADWSLLVPASVRALTVRHGPTDARFGDFALGGVVEVETVSEVTGSAGAAGASSFGDAWTWLQAGTSDVRRGVAVSATLRRDDGWRENAGVGLGSALVHGWHALGAGRLDGSIGAYGARWDSPGFIDTLRYASGSFDAMRAPMDTTDGGDGWRAFGTLRWTTQLSSSLVLRAGGWAQALDQTVFLNIPGGPLLRQTEEQERRALLGGTIELGLPLGPGVLEGAVQARLDDGRFTNTRTDERTPILVLDDLDFRYSSGSAYVRWRGEPVNRLRVDAALRGDLLRYRATDLLAADSTTQHDAGILAPKLGVEVSVARPLALHASVSRGFRGAPGVVYQTSAPPITAWAAEAGVTWRSPGLTAEASVFRYDVRNERIQDPISLQVSTAGSSVRQGLDLRVTAAPHPRVALRGHATINDATITAPASFTPRDALLPRTARSLEPIVAFHDDGGLVPGARVPGVASYFGQVGADVAVSGALQARATARFSGPFVPFREPSVETDPYLLLDLGLSWAVPGSPLAIDLDVQNVTSTVYPEVRASGYLNAGAPVALRLGMRLGALVPAGGAAP